MTKPLAVFLMGPTGAGKTDLAIRLYAVLPVSIISVDSAMIYRGMDIGTAKPDLDLRQRVPHALIDIKDPNESYSAAEFRADAIREMRRITATGRVPLLVGGTGLYFRSLEQGISPLPSADPAVRASILERARTCGWAALHEELKRADPVAALRIHPNDPQRIQRALEVFSMTGKPMSLWWAEGRDATDFDYDVVKIVWAPSRRTELAEQLQRRFHQMLECGLVEECRNLGKRYSVDLNLPASRLVGYRQVWSYLAGRYGRDEMIRQAITATHQLAKRQYTWFRAEPAATWFDAFNVDANAEVIKYLCRIGDLETK